MSESQICQKCGIPRPIEQFQLMKPKDSKPYRLKTCNKCRHARKVELKNKLSDDIEILTKRQYKTIPPQRILDVQEYGIDLDEEDEIFVKMTEYKDLFSADNIEEEKSMLFEDMVIHHICYCEAAENILNNSRGHERILDYTKLYKTFLIDLLSLDAFVFETQNVKDKRLGRNPTFKESEIKEATEKMYKSHAMMKKFNQVCNALENLQHKK